MKKLIFAAGFLLIATFLFGATQEVKEVAREWRTGGVDVSSTVVTLISSNGTGQWGGRYQIRIVNRDPTYAVAIGSHSNLTFAGGYVLSRSSDAATATIDLPLPAGTSVYGLTQANGVQGTANVRVIELK